MVDDPLLSSWFAVTAIWPHDPHPQPVTWRRSAGLTHTAKLTSHFASKQRRRLVGLGTEITWSAPGNDWWQFGLLDGGFVMLVRYGYMRLTLSPLTSASGFDNKRPVAKLKFLTSWEWERNFDTGVKKFVWITIRFGRAYHEKEVRQHAAFLPLLSDSLPAPLLHEGRDHVCTRWTQFLGYINILIFHSATKGRQKATPKE